MKDWNEVAEDDVDAMEDRQQNEMDQQKYEQPQIEDNLSFLKSEIGKNMEQVD